MKFECLIFYGDKIRKSGVEEGETDGILKNVCWIPMQSCRMVF